MNELFCSLVEGEKHDSSQLKKCFVFYNNALKVLSENLFHVMLIALY